MPSFLRRIPFHPLLIGIYPAIALWSHNVIEVEPAIVVRAIVVSAIIAILFQQVLRIVIHGLHRASAASSLVLTITLSYGHLYNFIHRPEVLGVNWGRHRYFIPFVIGLTILGCWWIAKKLKNPSTSTEILNLVSIVVLIFPVYQILSFQLRAIAAESKVAQNPTHNIALDSLHPPANQPLPDIYYIILDAYAREDVLQEYLDFDNADFLDGLGEMGFYISPCSQSNYSLSALSLASSLNMNYIDQLGIDLNNVDLGAMDLSARSSIVRRSLENLGYQVIAFESGYFVTEWHDADYYWSYSSHVPQLPFGVNAFESMFLSTTIGKVLYDFQAYLPKEMITFLNRAYTERREQILLILDRLESIPDIEGPKFVMAHILAPHAPFVFGPQGEDIQQENVFTLRGDVAVPPKSEWIEGYLGQLIYINHRIEHILQVILDKSISPPIIIIQADHGPYRKMTSDEAKMSILNAYYLPQEGEQLLYPGISPVNTFRVVFNHYFGGEYELLDDVARLSRYSNPFSFTIIPEGNPDCLRE
ncbi:MAG: hypothetical protein KAT23_06250 [Anaerolineales bacterium]|nr:hypothetical protein [Anaerolineales bacterium]